MAEGKKRKVNPTKQPKNHPTTHKKNKTEPRPRRHADVVERGKILWNQLRQKTLTKPDRRKLLDELIPLLSSNANEISLQHDGSRLVQAVLQFGTPKERSDLVMQLDQDSTILELACSQYAHFVLLKIFKYCERPQWEIVTTKLSSHMPTLAVHATASRVVEVMFQTIPKELKIPLQQELYGPHAALAYKNLAETPTVVPTLAWNLEELLPTKADTTMEFVRKLVQKGIGKNLFGHAYFQSLLCEFLQVIPPNEIRSSIAPSVADSILQLVSTRAGSHAAAWVISYSTVKDRKRISKSLKGYGKSGLLHANAYRCILRLVQVTDDTVTVQKNVLAEFVSSDDTTILLELALSPTGSKLLLMLLHDATCIEEEETKRTFLDPYDQSVLFLDPTVDGTPTSKKDKHVRAKEHLDYLMPTLRNVVTKHTEELLKSIAGQAIVLALYKYCHDDTDAKKMIPLSIPESLVHDPVGHRAVQKLTKLDLEVARKLLEESITLDGLLSSNRGAFCAVSLLEAVPDHDIWKSLTKQRVEMAAESSQSVRAGFDALLKVL